MDGTTAEAAQVAGVGHTDMATMLAALAPRGALETMLASQMAAVHVAALRSLRRAADNGEHPQIEALYLRQAARLMHLFARQAEALERRRAAVEKREMEQVWEAERQARLHEAEQREAERVRHEAQRRAHWDLAPARRRRAAEPAGRRGNGRNAEFDELAGGLSKPDPTSG